MKKIIMVIMSSIMMIWMAACGTKEEANTNTSMPTATVMPTLEPTVTPTSEPTATMQPQQQRRNRAAWIEFGALCAVGAAAAVVAVVAAVRLHGKRKDAASESAEETKHGESDPS